MQTSACILLVDGREGDRRSVAEAIDGHEVVRATSAREALELAEREDVAVVLVTAEMAERDDFALVRGLAAARLRVVVVGDVAEVVRAYDAGALDVVSVLAPSGVLRAKLERCLQLHGERRRLEDANRRLVALMEAAPVGLAYSTDDHGHFIHGNSTLRALFDFDAVGNVSASAREPDAVGRQVRYFEDGREVAPDDLPLQRARAVDKPIRAELEVQNGSGRVWMADVYGAPVHGTDGAPVGAVAIVVDVTERRRVEAALSASERRFRELADSVPQLVWSALPSGVVDYYNSRRTEYAGITQLPDGSWRWDTVVHPDDVERTIKAWREAVARNELYVCEHRIKMADGSFRWHLSRGRPVKDDATGVTRWFGTATDIHETKEIEARLRQNEARLVEALGDAGRAMEARDRLASAVSHDLRNPLNSIVTQVGLLRLQKKRGELDGERQEQGFARIERNAARMSRMLDELLDAARLAAGEPLALERSHVDLREIAQQVARDHQAGTSKHRIEVVVRAAAQGDWDRTRVERVVDNLVSNALKYSPDGGRVSIEIDCDGPGALLRVRDEGVGIAREDHEEIFRWFGRGRGTEGVRGTGIGLAGARQIAEQHGGSLRVESTRGKGSTFTLRLPTERVDAVVARRTDDSPKPLEPPDEREFLAALLRVRSVGFAILDAESGRFLFANPRYETLTGYSMEELRELTPFVLTHPEDRGSDHVRWLEVAEGRQQDYVSEKRYVRKNGEVIWVLVNAAPIWKGGRVVRTVGVIQEITELKESERRLAEAVRIREEFLATASHELRTPLAALTLQLGTLRRSLERNGTDTVAPYLAKVAGAERSSERLSALVDDLLDVSRFAREPLHLRRERADLAAVVTGVLDRYRIDAERAGCAIEAHLRPAWGSWDVARMEQVVRHLVSNALRFGARRPVEVTLRSTDDEGVELRVVDRGAGIDERDRERLFRPFERQGSTAHYGGLGLGLFVVKRVVEAHGGTVSVATEPGRGAAFLVHFPRHAVDAAPVAAEVWR